MNETLPRRREVMDEQIRQSEQYRAVKCLENFGIFRAAEELDLWHGRAGDGTNWEVKPSFNNASDNTGNYNINKIPALNTSNYSVAKEFSEARAYGDKSSEVHKIISDDPDAVIIDGRNSVLSAEERKEARNAIMTLSLPITEGAPLSFKHRHDLERVDLSDFINQYGVMFKEDISDLKRTIGIDEDLIMHVGSAINTKTFLKNGSIRSVCNAFLDNRNEIEVKINENEKRSIPISREYLASWFKANHVIGIKREVDSATLGKKIENIQLFDLEKVNTPEVYSRRERNRMRFFGKAALKATEKNVESESDLVKTLSSNLYIKPQEIIELAKKTPGFEEVFEADAGNWEGFKLGEHTETVLRIFDNNYADNIPASILPVMRIALLVHDIGKAEAVKRHDKGNQRAYNVEYAKRFMQLNRVDERTQNLIISLIGNGMRITEKMVINRGDKDTMLEFKNYCFKIATEYLGENADTDSAYGFKCLMEVLQTCDSAAYTTMAVTRGQNDVFYRNSGSFNGSFDPYRGLTGGRVRLNWKNK